MEYIFAVQSKVRGYYVYCAIWDAAIDGEALHCKREVGNAYDTFAVAVKKKRVIKRALSKEYDIELVYIEIPLQSLDSSQTASAKGRQIKQEVQEPKQMNNQDDQVQHQIIIDGIDEVGKAENQMDTTEDHPMPPAAKRCKLPNKEVQDIIMGQ